MKARVGMGKGRGMRSYGNKRAADGTRNHVQKHKMRDGGYQLEPPKWASAGKGYALNTKIKG